MPTCTFIMHQHAIFTDVEDMFAVDFDVVNRLAGFSAGERFKFPSRVISELQVFADSQVSCCDKLLTVFAPERMAGRGADRLVGALNSQVKNLGVLVGELGGDEVAVTRDWCRAGTNFADRKVGGDAVFREIDEDRAADGQR